MKFSLEEIARIINGKVVGDPSVIITGISGIKEAREGDLTFLANNKYHCLMKTTRASAVITSLDTTDNHKPLIKTKNPSLAFAKMIDFISPRKVIHPKGIHESAIIDDSAHLEKDVSIGPYVIIGKGVTIGEGSIIWAGSFIGNETKIGTHCLIYPNVTVREETIIGNNVIIHSGAVIGSDGFGFATVKGIQRKIPQIGTVLIEDDVEIGANVTIDRARFDKTVIGKGTKIDNLVQIAHNVVIGQHCTIVSQAGISGSTSLGKGVILAGQAGIVGHITLGDGAIVAAQAGVTKSVPANTKVSGYPAKPHNKAKRVNACIQRLPELYAKIQALQKRIEELEKNNG